jgi:hypothetical protein
LADFTYAITVKAIKIQDTGKGTKSVAEDLGPLGTSEAYKRGI